MTWMCVILLHYSSLPLAVSLSVAPSLTLSHSSGEGCAPPRHMVGRGALGSEGPGLAHSHTGSQQSLDSARSPLGPMLSSMAPPKPASA